MQSRRKWTRSQVHQHSPSSEWIQASSSSSLLSSFLSTYKPDSSKYPRRLSSCQFPNQIQKECKPYSQITELRGKHQTNFFQQASTARIFHWSTHSIWYNIRLLQLPSITNTDCCYGFLTLKLKASSLMPPSSAMCRSSSTASTSSTISVSPIPPARRFEALLTLADSLKSSRMGPVSSCHFLRSSSTPLMSSAFSVLDNGGPLDDYLFLSRYSHAQNKRFSSQISRKQVKAKVYTSFC